MFLAADAKKITMSFQIENPQVEVGLLGTQDKYVAIFEEGMNVTINPFGNELKISGEQEDVHLTIQVLQELVDLLTQGIMISSADIVSAMKMAHRGTLQYFGDLYNEKIINDRKGRPVRVKKLRAASVCPCDEG